jgi:hypothetical protein
MLLKLGLGGALGGRAGSRTTRLHSIFFATPAQILAELFQKFLIQNKVPESETIKTPRQLAEFFPLFPRQAVRTATAAANMRMMSPPWRVLADA